MIRPTVFLAASLGVVLWAVPAFSATCESLASLSLPDTTITSAQPVAAGAFSQPGRAGRGNAAAAYSDVPAFCRIVAVMKPSSDSDINLEVWLPLTGWNKKYQAVGNGAWAGSIVYGDLAKNVRMGYATSSSDTGHTGGSGSFALGHPEKLVDFGWRSEHEMTVKAKAFINAFYGEAPKLSYFVSCSSGGKQALKEAQRFPNDYDGLVAGAPVVNWTHRSVAALWAGTAALKDPVNNIPAAKFPMIHEAAINACDAADGVKDGLISEPAKCHFDPATIQCKDADGPACLTAGQVEAVRKIYTPATNPRTGEILNPRYEPGSELGWRAIAGGPNPFGPAVDYFRFVVFKDPMWDWRTLNFDSDITLTDKVDDNTINATDPDLKAFTGHGGKLIMYQGYSDTNIPPGGAINYYNAVAKTIGAAKTADSVRLYMAPGMNHCGGGEGPNVFDMQTALEQWVENKKAPVQIIASHTTDGKVDRTRPLCPHPQVAKYKGSGSIDDAANFSCKRP